MTPRPLETGDRIYAFLHPTTDELVIASENDPYAPDEIVVVMEAGQAAYVPWIATISDGQEIGRYNVAHLTYLEVEQ